MTCARLRFSHSMKVCAPRVGGESDAQYEQTCRAAASSARVRLSASASTARPPRRIPPVGPRGVAARGGVGGGSPLGAVSRTWLGLGLWLGVFAVDVLDVRAHLETERD